LPVPPICRSRRFELPSNGRGGAWRAWDVKRGMEWGFVTQVQYRVHDYFRDCTGFGLCDNCLGLFEVRQLCGEIGHPSTRSFDSHFITARFQTWMWNCCQKKGGMRGLDLVPMADLFVCENMACCEGISQQKWPQTVRWRFECYVRLQGTSTWQISF